MDKIDIHEEIKNKAVLCSLGHACLSNPKEFVCPPQYLIEETVLFVDKKETVTCNYLLPYGLSGVCMCPVRKELYKKHKI